MALPVNIHIQPLGLKFDWHISAINSNIIEHENQFFLIYDFRSAGAGDDSWNYSNSDLNEKNPVSIPRQLLLEAEVSLLGNVVVTSIDVFMSLSKQSKSPIFTIEDRLVATIALSEYQTNFRTNLSIDLGEHVTNKDFCHGERYKAHIQLVAKDVSDNIVGLSTWLETEHILHVNVVAPILTIISPNFLQDSGGNSTVIVENKNSVLVELITSDDCEIRLQKDYSYPSGTGRLTSTNSSLVSSSGKNHSILIDNPDINSTNGLRFTLAARDTKYKNISPNGWGRFNYNILFQKKEYIMPTISWTYTPETNVDGFYNLDNSLIFSGNQINVGAIKLELWQSHQKKVEQVCSIVGSQWHGSFNNLLLSGIKEGEVVVKAIATSYTGTISELLWTGCLLKTPQIFIGQPIENTSISKTEFLLSGHVVNSLSYLENDRITIVVYKENDNGIAEIERKQIKPDAGGQWIAQITNLSDGAYELEAIAKNILGLSHSVTKNIAIELTPPFAQIMYPSANSFHREQTLVVSGTYSDATSIVVEAWQNSELLGTYNSVLVENGTWSANASGLSHGKIDFKIKVHNSVSDLMQIIWHTIFVDIEAPVVYIDRILGKNIDNLETIFPLMPEIQIYANNLIIETHAEDGLSKIVSYSLIINGNLIKTTIPELSESSLRVIEPLLLTSSSNRIEILYTDLVGNVGKAKILDQDFINIRYTPYNESGPVLVINHPQNNARIGSSSLEVSGICNDVHGTQQISIDIYRLDSLTPYITSNDVIISNNLWHTTIQGLESGINIIRAHGVDGLGMASAIFAETSVLVDTDSPIIHSFSIPDIVNSDSCNVVIEASDSHSGLSSYFAEVENESGIISVIETVNFEPTILPDTRTTVSFLLPLTRGKNIVRVTFVDLLGNTQTQSQVTIYKVIDTSPPIVVVDCDSAYTQLPALFDVAVSDNESGLKKYTVDLYPLMRQSEIMDNTPFYRLATLPMQVNSNLVFAEEWACYLKKQISFIEVLNLDNYIVDQFTFQGCFFVSDYVGAQSVFVWENETKKIEFGLNYLDGAGNNTEQLWLKITVNDDSKTILAPRLVSGNEWQRLTFSVENNNISIFSDKTLLKTELISQSIFPLTGGSCYLGRDSNRELYCAHIKFWNKGLTSSEVQDNDQTFIAFWRCNNEINAELTNSVNSNVQAFLRNGELINIIPAQKQYILRLPPKTLVDATYLTTELEGNVLSDFIIELDIKINALVSNTTLATCYNTKNTDTIALKINESGQILLELLHKNVKNALASFVSIVPNTILKIKATISNDGLASLHLNNKQVGRGSILVDNLLVEKLDIGDKNTLSDILFYRLNFLDKNLGMMTFVGRNHIWETEALYDQSKFRVDADSILFSGDSCNIRNLLHIGKLAKVFKTNLTYFGDFIDPAHLIDGRYTLKISATNLADLTTTVFKEFYIDTLQPNFYFVPSDGKIIPPSFEPQLYFNKSMDTGSVENKLTILPNSADSYWEWSDESKIATYKHTNEFLSGTVLALKLDAGAKDSTSGQYTLFSKSAFYIVGEETNTPQVLATIPSLDENNVPLRSKIEIFFSHSMNLATIIPDQTLKVINQKTLQFETLFLEYVDPLQKRFVFRFSKDLDPGTTYQITVNQSVESVAGMLLGENSSFVFKTENVIKPNVEYSFPVFSGINGCSIPLDNKSPEYTNISLRKLLEKKLGVGNVGAIYWYDNTKQKWVGDLLGRQVMNTFKWQDGFFVTLNLKKITKLSFTGSVIEHGSMRINLKKGLNLISIPVDNGASNIKSLLREISEQIGQPTIVAYMNRRLKLTNRYEELLGYTYVGDSTHGALDFRMDRLGGDAIAIVVDKDCSFFVQGNAWQD